MVNVGTGEVARSVSRTTQGDIDELLMRVVPQVANELAEKPGDPSPMRPAVGTAPVAVSATTTAPSRSPESPAPQVKSSSWGWWVAGGLLVLGGGAAALVLKKNSDSQGQAPDQNSTNATRSATFSWNP